MRILVLLQSGAPVDPAALQLAAVLDVDSKVLKMLLGFQALDMKG